MPFSVGAAIAAGLGATAVMTAVLYMGIAAMPRQMTMNLLYMLGTMLTRSKGAAYIVGAIIHAMMGVVFALIHIAFYGVFNIESDFALWGLLFGLAHYLVVGMAMGMVGAMHPLMKSGELQAPGVYVKDYPAMTTGGFLMLHLLYGLLVAVFYSAWA